MPNLMRNAALLIPVLWATSTSPGGAAEAPSKLPPKAQFHVYLLMGQSNMAGRLGEFYVRSGRSAYAGVVDAALVDLPNRVENTGCASAEGLDHKGDVVHFSADALRELGRRYAAEMIRLEKQRAK